MIRRLLKFTAEETREAIARDQEDTDRDCGPMEAEEVKGKNCGKYRYAGDAELPRPTPSIHPHDVPLRADSSDAHRYMAVTPSASFSSLPSILQFRPTWHGFTTSETQRDLTEAEKEDSKPT